MSVLRRRRFLCGSVTAGALAAISVGVLAHVRSTSVTWSRDVRPIIEKRCLGCHRAGGRSSVPLESYDDARAAASRIKPEVLEHRMPPWPAARGFGDFANDRSLSPVETDLLVAWVDGGAPKGEEPDPGELRREGGLTQGRTPPLVLQIGNAHSVADATQTFELPTALTRDGWIEAWEFRPGNPGVVEQAELSIEGGSLIGTWVPPETITRFPAGVAQRLPAGSRILLRVFYRKIGGLSRVKSNEPMIDRSSVAFYLTTKPRRTLRHRRLPCGSSRLPAGIEALAIRPRASRAGVPVEATARRPGGHVEALCWIREYQLRYEATYRFRHPVALPAGTEIVLHSPEPGCGADLEYVLNPGRTAGRLRSGGNRTRLTKLIG